MTSTFKSQVTKDSLVFSAAHFITFNGNICERLHGHNWRVDVVVVGQLDENQYVCDFIKLRDMTQEFVSQLDHRVLLPDRHPQISVDRDAERAEVAVRFQERRWVFPQEDCFILPVANTTAELIAGWFAENLISRLSLAQNPRVSELQVGIEENFGQWAWFHQIL